MKCKFGQIWRRSCSFKHNRISSLNMTKRQVKMDISAVEWGIKKSPSINHWHHLTLQTADPSCAPNITHHHLNTLWLEPDTKVHPAVHWSGKGLSTKYGLPLPSSLHPPCSQAPWQGQPYFIPLGWLCERLPCHSIHHFNSALHDWRTEGVINRAWLVALTLPVWHRAGIFGDEGIGGLRLGWRAARAECLWHSSGTPSHTNTHAAVAYASGVQGVHANAERIGAPQAHFTQLRNRPLPAAREGQCIIGLILLSTRVEVMD